MSGIGHHIFFFEDVKSISNELIDTRSHTTLNRSITSYTFFNKGLKAHATITNMLGIILFTLYSKREQEEWRNTEIINGEGIIRAENQFINSICSNKLSEILRNARESATEISDKQKEVINNRVKSKLDDFKQSKIFEDLKKDFKLKDNKDK